jgi:hypothetical protein
VSDDYIHMAEGLASTVKKSVDQKAGQWFSDSLATVSRGYERNTFLAAYAGAGRRLRAFPVAFTVEDLSAAKSLGLLSFPDWSLDRLARCALLGATLLGSPHDEQPSIVDEVFRAGDNDERESLLAGLLLFPEPARFLSTAVEACRTNVETVFSALVCENAYPSIYFPEASFNQMTMKAVFIGLPLARVVGLAERRNDELARMADDFSDERTAAGRPVPSDLELITPRSGSSANNA